jgi:hypothetical protein
MSSEVKMWRYAIPTVDGLSGWAILFLDSTGCFSALSDYENWSYRWNSRGFVEGEDFRKFLLKCDDDYLLRKINPKKEYDEEKTYAAAKEVILGLRREKEFTKEEALEEWELLKEYDALGSEFDLHRWAMETKLGDVGELYCVKHSEQARAFLKHCWPRLKELMKNDLGL